MEKTKEQRIKKEFNRLKALFKSLPESEQKFIVPLLENASFMKVTLEDLQVRINEAGCIDDYQNGENQTGKKASAEIQAYNTTFKNYQSVMLKLREHLPMEEKTSKLDMLLAE